MFDPNSTILIHKTMIQEELQRSHPVYHLTSTDREPGRGAITITRTITARALLALGSRISPLPVRATEQRDSTANTAHGARKAGAG